MFVKYNKLFGPTLCLVERVFFDELPIAEVILLSPASLTIYLSIFSPNQSINEYKNAQAIKWHIVLHVLAHFEDVIGYDVFCSGLSQYKCITKFGRKGTQSLKINWSHGAGN
jgi:hypothetical protein